MNSNDAKLELLHGRAECFYLKLSLGTVLGLILLIALSWGGHDAYVRWQEQRLIECARFAMEHADDRTASVAARSALELRPSSAPAARIMAELAERAGNRAALDWRRQVVGLQPNSLEDKLTWAKCALQFNDFVTAARALSLVDEAAARRSAGYHAFAALLAQARGEEAQAEGEWILALQLTPGERNYQLQLGMLRLRANDAERRALGKTMLGALRNDSKLRAPATRALINDAIARQGDAQSIIGLARELQAYPEAGFSDRLLFLDVLRQLGDPEFTAYLSDLEKNTVDNAPNLAALLSWMSQSNLNLLALDFVRGLSAESVEKWPVSLALANVYTQIKDWRSLQTATNTANWQQSEYLRHAYLARALREQDQPVAAHREWSIAAQATTAQNEHLLSLARTAAEWGWHKEAVELLWQLSKDADTQSEALQALYLHYAKLKDTQGLYRVLIRLFEMDPKDSKVQNNLAQVSLLLGADRERAQRLAANLYRREGSNATYAATYAYSLYVEGDIAGAVKIIAGLGEEQLRDPAVAAYAGVFLAASGDKAKATDYLARGARANLLPEEKVLVEKAQRGLVQAH